MVKRLAVLVVLVSLAGVAVWWRSGEAPGNGALTLYGNVDVRDVRLGFRVSGRLADMALEEGDPVEAGQVLAHLDDEPYREAAAVAEARVAAAAANLSKLQTGLRPQEIERARAAVREARAAAEDAARELDRQRSLRIREATSQRNVDAAEARARETAARLDGAGEALALAEEGFRREDVEAAQAELTLARAEAERAATALADTVLVAPAAGSVLTRVREPGSVLAAGEAVYSVALARPVWVRAYVDEPDLGRVVPGLGAEVQTDGGRSYRGQVGFVSPQAEFTPRSVQTERLRTDLVYRLRIVVAEPDGGLRQGMPVTVVLDTQPGTRDSP